MERLDIRFARDFPSAYREPVADVFREEFDVDTSDYSIYS